MPSRYTLTLFSLLLSPIANVDAFTAIKGINNNAAVVTSAKPLFMAGDAAAAAAAVDAEQTKSIDSDSVLPELKGDFNWDDKFGDDDDWQSGPDVPGRIVLGEIDLAKQVTALDKLEEKWRKERLRFEYEDARRIGWVDEAEYLNSRTAMFFIVTGLLTEYWTGFSMPQQVEEMLRIAGVIGFEN